MQRSTLILEAFGSGCSTKSYRSIFKNNHSRTIYLSVEVIGEKCVITDCFYTDRKQGKSETKCFSARPARLTTLNFSVSELLSVIERELDKMFFNVDFVENSTIEMSIEEYLAYHESCASTRYRFLIMEGSGNLISGLPSCLRTRLKNKLHRSVYIELAYYKDGKGVVKQCCYYDRSYLRKDISIIPPMLISCFFPYTREGIINLINDEICCNFTHIIVTDGIEGINLDSDTIPICGCI